MTKLVPLYTGVIIIADYRIVAFPCASHIYRWAPKRCLLSDPNDHESGIGYRGPRACLVKALRGSPTALSPDLPDLRGIWTNLGARHPELTQLTDLNTQAHLAWVFPKPPLLTIHFIVIYSQNERQDRTYYPEEWARSIGQQQPVYGKS
jgi:hypothetical protein